MNKRAKHTTIDYFCPSSHAQILSIGKKVAFKKMLFLTYAHVCRTGNVPLLKMFLPLGPSS